MASRVADIDDLDFFSSEEQIQEIEGKLEEAQQKIVNQEELIYKLQALAGTYVKPTNTTEVSLAIQAIVRDPDQVRRWFDPVKLAGLTESIKEVGIRERLWVRPLFDGKYQLIAGERRYRAATDAGLTEIPVVILDIDNNLALTLSLAENLQREDLNPVEETEGLLRLLSLRLGMENQEVASLLYKMKNQEEGRVRETSFPNEQVDIIQSVFTTVGRISWQSFISTRLPLLNLPSNILSALRQGKIEYTKARIIARIKDDEARQLLLQEAIDKELSRSDIQARIKAMKPDSLPSLRNKFKDLSSQMLKLPSTEWENSKKTKKIAKLLEQLEDLLIEYPLS